MKKTDKPMIINFWATWCRPCIKEMPYFEGLKTSLQEQGKEFDVILVSLDDVELLETKVLPFAQRRELKSKLYLLDETDYNEIIDKIDPKWSGAIPATIFIDNKKKKREFHEKEFEKEDLENIVKQFLNS
jgi:thiol-disulfide isomerase/thioredoxin